MLKSKYVYCFTFYSLFFFLFFSSWKQSSFMSKYLKFKCKATCDESSHHPLTAQQVNGKSSENVGVKSPSPSFCVVQS